jgi:hypothetical protein
VKWHIFLHFDHYQKDVRIGGRNTPIAFDSFGVSPLYHRRRLLQVEFLILTYISKHFHITAAAAVKGVLAPCRFFPITVALKAPPTIVSQRCGRILVA